MDVYVVSNVWDHGGATIIGAGADESGAKAIADRVNAYADRVNAYGDRWDEWTERYDPPLNRAFLGRVALLPDGSQHPSLSQEIVRVPLAGHIESGDPIADMRGARGEYLAYLGYEAMNAALTRPVIVSDASGVTSGRPWDDPGHDILADLRGWPPLTSYEALIDAMRLVTGARADNRDLGFTVDQIRIGAGAAKRYFERAAARFRPPDAKPVEIGGTLIQGLRIVVDPAMPPSMIRIGDVAYLIDVPGDGQMIRINDEVLRNLDGLPGFTSPRGSDPDPTTGDRSTPRTPDRSE